MGLTLLRQKHRISGSQIWFFTILMTALLKLTFKKQERLSIAMPIFSGYLQRYSNLRVRWMWGFFLSTGKSAISLSARQLTIRGKIWLSKSNWVWISRDLEFALSGTPYVVVDPGFMESEWHLKYCPASISVRTSESGEEFSQYTFSLFLERKPLFWILNIIIPIMLMFFLSAGVFYVKIRELFSLLFLII